MLKTTTFLCLCSIPCFAFYQAQTMTLEEKVGQLMMVHFHGEVANEDARTLIQDTKVGGIIYYNWSNGLHSPEQVQSLSAGLQMLTQSNKIPIPLIIATDQEGGIIARLHNGFTVFPGNRALGEASDPNLAEAAALAMGQELQAVGVNMNLGPVVDINSNPRNPVIGIRAFGDCSETVFRFGEKALQGYNKAHIMTTLKHFPGHGDTTVDSHEALPIVNRSMQALEQVELLPFAKLASKADAIMTAHTLVPALDPDNCSTLSEKTLNYLKDALGFRGVIISDSLVMEGVLKKCHTIDEAAIQALNAGCDILLLGGKQLIGENSNLELTVSDVQRIHHNIVGAVRSGRITELRLNQAVEKILALKDRCLCEKLCVETPIHQLVNTFEHRELAQRIASLALKTIQNNLGNISPLREKKTLVIAPQLLSDSIHQTPLLKIGKSSESLFYSGLSPSSADANSARQLALEADVLIICSYNAWKNPSQEAMTQSLLDAGKPVVLLVLRDPLDTSLFPRANLVVNTFSPTTPSIQAVCDLLERLHL